MKLRSVHVLASYKWIANPARAATTSQENMPTEPSPRPLILLATAMASALFLKT